MRNLASSNDGNSYILTCIDVFSRYAFAVPVKDERGSTVAAAFEKIFVQCAPNMLQTDRCTEFYNVQVQDLFKKNGVRHYSSLNDDIKAALVERFNRTLKSRLFGYIARNHAKRWIDVINDVVNSYNRSHHRSIGAAPIDVTSENEDEIPGGSTLPNPRSNTDTTSEIKFSLPNVNKCSRQVTYQTGKRRFLRSSTGIRLTPLRTVSRT
jgi:L-rhamnose mutarotase